MSLNKFRIEDSYFENLRKVFEDQFEFIGQSYIDTDDSMYHISASYAKETCQVFRLPNKALFLIVKSREHVWPDGDGLGNIHTSASIMLEAKTPICSELKSHTEALTFEGFRHVGYASFAPSTLTYEVNIEANMRDTPIVDMARAIREGLDPVISLLKEEPFVGLTYLGAAWTCEFVFPNSKKLFWERFGEAGLKRIWALAPKTIFK